MIIYCGCDQKDTVLSLKAVCGEEIVCKEVKSLWDLSFLESLSLDVLGEKYSEVFVINPRFKILDSDFIAHFIHEAKDKDENIYFSPQVNPKSPTQEIICFSVKRLDSMQNFLIEVLYKQKAIGVTFRNLLHANARGSCVSDLHIPKYLTNLDSHWALMMDSVVSDRYLEAYHDLFYPHPTNIHVALSNRCNLKCVMCPYHAPRYRDMHTTTFFDHANYMPIDVFEKIASYCGEHEIFLQIGQLDEPLLHPHFLDFLEIIKKHNVKLNITTNGTLLKKEYAHALADVRIENLTFSLDAIDKESYKSIRGYDYDETLSKIEYFLKVLSDSKKNTRVGVCFILQGDYEVKSQEFLEYWIKTVDFVKFHQLAVFDLDKETGLLATSVKDQFRIKQDSRYPCSVPYSVLFVLPDSKVTFCCNAMTQYSTTVAGGGAIIGDLSHESLAEIWHGEGLKMLYKELSMNQFDRFKLCESCLNWRQGDPDSSMIELKGVLARETKIDCELIYERVKYEYRN